VAAIARRVQDLFKTNKPIIITEEEQIAHVSKSTCNFSIKKQKVADHCHLSSKFRQTKQYFQPKTLKNLTLYRASYIICLITMQILL